MRLDEKNYAKALNWSLIWVFSGLIFLVFGAIKYGGSACSCPAQFYGMPDACHCANQAAVFSIEWGAVFLAGGAAIQVLARRWRVVKGTDLHKG